MLKMFLLVVHDCLNFLNCNITVTLKLITLLQCKLIIAYAAYRAWNVSTHRKFNNKSDSVKWKFNIEAVRRNICVPLKFLGTVQEIVKHDRKIATSKKNTSYNYLLYEYNKLDTCLSVRSTGKNVFCSRYLSILHLFANNKNYAFVDMSSIAHNVWI